MMRWNGYWGSGWWWPAMLCMGVFMMLCVVMMVRMMSHGTHGWSTGGWHLNRPDDPEDILAGRLARGEIDSEEYERCLAVLHRTSQADVTRGSSPAERAD